MSQQYSCPVCGRRGLPQTCARCPQCDADLTCFQVLDALSEPAAAKPAAKGRRLPLLAVLLLLAAGLLAVFALSMRSQVKELDRRLAEFKAAEAVKQKEAPPVAQAVAQQPQAAAKEEKAAGQLPIAAEVKVAENRQEPPASPAAAEPPVMAAAVEQKAEAVETPVQEVAAEDSPAQEAEGDTGSQLALQPKEAPVLRAKTKKRLVAVRPPVPAAVVQELPEASHALRPQPAETAPPSPTFLYQVREGESLQDIAERFYGDRRYYPVILEQNPYLISTLSGGNWMRLFTDARQAAALYARRAERQNGVVLWRYAVRPGETWRTIYARFFPPQYSGRVFYENNPQIVPGSTVLIILR